jgi:hypothetical protein
MARGSDAILSAGMEPQIAHSYARANVKIDLLGEDAKLGTYAQGGTKHL